MEKIEIIKILKEGGIGVLATDTLYGLVGRALSLDTVERIYKVRRRDPDKPLIILIHAVEDLKLFGILPESSEALVAQKYWSGKISIILPCDNPDFGYLHRGTKTLAFRLPENLILQEILSETGPLVAPSANLEGLLPALIIDEAKGYFGTNVDFYLDGGIVEPEPSTIIKIEGNKASLIREGAVKVKLF